MQVEEISNDNATEKVNRYDFDPYFIDEFHSWIAKATKDKITNIVKGIFFIFSPKCLYFQDVSETRLLLVNAVHYKCEWSSPFSAR